MKIISSGILVLGILIIRKAAWKSVSRNMQYSVWLFAALFFLAGSFVSIPGGIGFEHMISYLYDNSRISQEAESFITDERVGDFGTNVFYVDEKKTDDDYPNILPESSDHADMQINTENSLSEKEVVPDKKAVLPNRQIIFDLPDVWLVLRWTVTEILLIYIVILNVRFYFECKKNRSFYQTESSEGLTVYLLNEIASPFLLGKSIYIDPEMTEDKQSLEHILLHEACHYKKGDLFWMGLRYLCVCINWYNPFAWIAAYYVRRDCELACDESVLRRIGDHASASYGSTLLNLQKYQNKRKISIATAMSNRKNMLKERIMKIQDIRKSNILVTVCIVVFMSILTGCAFSAKTENDIINRDSGQEPNDTKVLIVEENEPSQNIERVIEDDVDAGNHYYNSVIYFGEYFYYADGNTLCRRKAEEVPDETGKVEVLVKGSIKLGNISNGSIYYIKFPTDAGESGVYRMDCETLVEKKLLSWDDSFWQCQNVYAENGKLFLEMTGRCAEYDVSETGVQEIAEEDNSIFKDFFACGLPASSINMLESGYVSTYFEHGLFILYDAKSCRLEIYDARKKQMENEIAGCNRDIIVADKGLVYTGLDNCVYLSTWKNHEPVLLYDPMEHDRQKLNYGTYDSNYLYGFTENGTDAGLVRISWDGEYQAGMVFDNITRAVDLGLSVNKGCLSFHQNGSLHFATLSSVGADGTVKNKEKTLLMKEDFLAMREIALAEMTDEDIARLKENIKVANLRMEHGYVNENLLKKLSDKDSPYWQFFDVKGEIQLGRQWFGDDEERRSIMKQENLTMKEFLEKYGEPETIYNRFDAMEFMSLMGEMKELVKNEALREDLQTIIDETQMAADTHDVKHVEMIFKYLHDMDYYLLRYAPDDVGPYVHDDSLIQKYYGVLNSLQVINTIDATFATYSKLSDGTWLCDGQIYKYKLEIKGPVTNEGVEATFVYLSNLKEISFDRAFKAAGFSSNSNDYFSKKDAVFVDWIP